MSTAEPKFEQITITTLTYAYCPGDGNAYPVGVVAYGVHNNQSFWAHCSVQDAGTIYARPFSDETNYVIMNNMAGFFVMIGERVSGLVAEMASKKEPFDLIEEIKSWTEENNLRVCSVNDIRVLVGIDLGASVLDTLHFFLEKMSLAIEPGIDHIFEYGFQQEWFLGPNKKILN